MILLLQVVAWGVALAWMSRAFAAWRGLPGITDLRESEWNRRPGQAATLTVIVPARDEGANIEACLRSLLAQDARIEIVAVDDRSEDETGEVMDRLVAEEAGRTRARLHVLHIKELPAGWLGKTHAMAEAAKLATTEYLLFTDGDVLFSLDVLRRSLIYAEATRADHLVVVPTTIIRRWDEAGLLGFFQIFGLWGVRPWKVADAGAKRDAVGVGAFNLVRRSAYETIGGFEGFPMEIVEDLGLGRRIKWAGLRQRIAFAPGLVRVHWAAGAWGLVNVMTKNLFSAFNFRVALAGLACGWLILFAVLPFVEVWVPGFHLVGLCAVAGIGWAYWLMGRISRISAWNALLAPFAGGMFCYTVLRSMGTTLLMLAAGGWATIAEWTDPQHRFAILLAEVKPPRTAP